LRVPWEKLSRATFIPERTSLFRTAALLLAGPNVQIILVLRIFAPANFVSCETTVSKYGYFVDAGEGRTIAKFKMPMRLKCVGEQPPRRPKGVNMKEPPAILTEKQGLADGGKVYL
jgi:hypothetical protein